MPEKRENLANKKKSAGRRGNKTGKGGFADNPQNINLAGRPKDGESHAAILAELMSKTPEELAAMVGGRSTDLGRAFLQMPKKVQMKYLIHLRTLADQMFQPSSGILNILWERTDGKIPDKHEIGGAEGGPVQFSVIYVDKKPVEGDGNG